MSDKMLLYALRIIAKYCFERISCKECCLRNFCIEEFMGYPEDWELGELSEDMQKM